MHISRKILPPKQQNPEASGIIRVLPGRRMRILIRFAAPRPGPSSPQVPMGSGLR